MTEWDSEAGKDVGRDAGGLLGGQAAGRRQLVDAPTGTQEKKTRRRRWAGAAESSTALLKIGRSVTSHRHGAGGPEGLEPETETETETETASRASTICGLWQLVSQAAGGCQPPVGLWEVCFRARVQPECGSVGRVVRVVVVRNGETSGASWVFPARW